MHITAQSPLLWQYLADPRMMRWVVAGGMLAYALLWCVVARRWKLGMWSGLAWFCVGSFAALRIMRPHAPFRVIAAAALVGGALFYVISLIFYWPQKAAAATASADEDADQRQSSTPQE